MIEFKNMQQHARDARKVRELFCEMGSHPVIFSSPSSHVTRALSSSAYRLDLSKLKYPLHLDKERMRILVEPGLTMQDLVQTTLPHGLLPLVVPEFKGITVGGAIQGAALESSSFLHGQFNDHCTHYEVLLGNKEILPCSPYQESDLFYGLSGSYGTLGALLAVEIQLAKASSWVVLDYTHFTDKEELLKTLEQKAKQASCHYLEAILFSQDHGVIIEGRLTDTPPSHRIKNRLYPWKPWFYSLAQTSYHQEAMALYDYLFRFDRGAFWIGSYLSDPHWLWRYCCNRKGNWIPYGGSSKVLDRLIPFCLGGFLTSAHLYKVLRNVPRDWVQNTFVIQDFYMPFSQSQAFLQETSIYPIWLCPVLATSTKQIMAPHFSTKETLLVDIGVYGAEVHASNAKSITRRLEECAKGMGGRKMLYADSYYPPEEFWQIYDRTSYQTLRSRYRADSAFPSIEKKVLCSS